MHADHQRVRMHDHCARLLQDRAHINSTQGLTANGACIEIAANFVILDGGKKSITGPGGTTPTGIGVWVHHKYRLDFIEFRGSVISGWDVGLLIQGRQIFADDVSANTNGTAGVELCDAAGCRTDQPDRNRQSGLRNMGEAHVHE